jgi:hypothetical protein
MSRLLRCRGEHVIQRLFRMMGTEIRVYLGGQHDAGLLEPDAMLDAVEEQLAEFDRRLSRFDREVS